MSLSRSLVGALGWLAVLAWSPRTVGAQSTAELAVTSEIVLLDLIAGRSFPVPGSVPITKVTVANPAVADVMVINDREIVVNGVEAGETDIIVWYTGGARRHYRVMVRSSADRQQILLSVKFAEVRRDAMQEITTSLLRRGSPGSPRVGTGDFLNNDQVASTGQPTLAGATRFLSAMSSFNTTDLLGLLSAEATRGNARFLAEPTIMAANREEAEFLAGGEVPIPIVQGGAGQQMVSVMFREFGIRLKFRGEVLSDSLLKIKLRPEVSSLDYSNAVLVSGFRIPALRTRRIESTVDVLTGRSLVLLGLFNDEREQVMTGIPYLMNLPMIGKLFASTRWQRNESELVVIITPVILDPNNPRSADQLLQRPEERKLPAAEMLDKQFWPTTSVPPTRPPASSRPTP